MTRLTARVLGLDLSLCECGCGLPAPLAQRNDPRRGYTAGIPTRFIRGHNVEALPFWDRVHRAGPDDCWPWTGCRTADGYGRLRYRRRITGAHRVAYELANGAIPGGLYVCHRCDNPPCCNPAHLFVGTAGDNNRDKAAKGRARTGHSDHQRPQGVDHGMARLTEAHVLEIRQRHDVGETQSSLAREFGVHLSTVHLIVHRKKWRHLP